MNIKKSKEHNQLHNKRRENYPAKNIIRPTAVKKFTTNQEFFADIDKNLKESMIKLSDEEITAQSLKDLNRLKPALEQQFLTQNNPHKTAIFMAGAPGAGKSEVAKTLAGQLKVDHIDADKIKATLPNYQGIKAHLFQRASSRGVEHLFTKALQKGCGFILDSTFSNYQVRKNNLKKAIDKGYSPEIYFIYRLKSIAKNHIKNRYVDDGRVVPESVFEEKYRESIDTVLAIYKKFEQCALTMLNLDTKEILKNDKASVEIKRIKSLGQNSKQTKFRKVIKTNLKLNKHGKSKK